MCVLSHVQLFATIAHEALLSVGLSRQEYWSGWPFPPPENLPDSGIELASAVSCIAGGFFTVKPREEPQSGF